MQGAHCCTQDTVRDAEKKLTFDHLDVYSLNSEYPEVHNVYRHSIDTRSSVKTVFHEIGTSFTDEIWQTNK